MAWKRYRPRGLRFALRRLIGPIRSAYWRRQFEHEDLRTRAAARPGPKSVVVVLDGLHPHINPGMIVRSADGLGAREVILVGMDYFNPSSACGTIGNIPLRSMASMQECHSRLVEEGYRVFALEPLPDLVDERYLEQVELPEKTAFIVGNETDGVSFTPEEFPDIEWIAIRQYGKVRCMNATVATSIALYEYTRQHP